jgi:hypothetical protein
MPFTLSMKGVLIPCQCAPHYLSGCFERQSNLGWNDTVIVCN